GGTIGMQRSEHGYVPVSGHPQRQLALMPEFHRPEIRWDHRYAAL
ncbi:L-asparaginase 1, partial [Klebsiella pneumoniae]